MDKPKQFPIHWHPGWRESRSTDVMPGLIHSPYATAFIMRTDAQARHWIARYAALQPRLPEGVDSIDQLVPMEHRGAQCQLSLDHGINVYAAPAGCLSVIAMCWLLMATVFFSLKLALAQTPYAELIVSPTQLLAHPASYDGAQVGVTGTVQQLQAKTTQRGNDYESFKLCDKACVKVFTWGHPALHDGQSETVHGTFAEARHVGSNIYYNEIEADEAWVKQCCSDQ